MDYLAKFRKASVKEVFPKEFLDKTVGEALTEGSSIVRKLLVKGDFAK